MRAGRILLVLREQWPRALLRAELRERGYDAVAAPRLSDALVYPAHDPERGPVRLLVIDEAELTPGTASDLEELRGRHVDARLLLLGKGGEPPPGGPWAAVVRAPAEMADVLRAVERLLPSNAGAGGRSRD